jgi:hypothetical protein
MCRTNRPSSMLVSRRDPGSGASIHPEGLARVSDAHPFPFRSVQARTPRPTQYPQDLPASQTQSPAIIVGLCRIATLLWPHFVASAQRVPVYRYRRRGRAVVIFIYIAPPVSKIAATWATSRGRALRRMPGFVVGEAPPPGSARSLFMDQLHQSDGEGSELRVYRAPVPGLGSNDDLQCDSEGEDDRRSKD